MTGVGADERVRAAWSALAAHHRRSVLRGRSRWRARRGWRAPAAEAWPLGQVLHAAALLDDRGAVTQVLRQFSRSDTGTAITASPRSHDVYLDDNAWIGLASLQALAGPAAGVRATGVLHRRIVQAARLCAEHQRADGGVPWRLATDDVTVNACSTAPGALAMLGAPLAGLGALAGVDALERARRAERFLREHLCTADGCVADHVRADGSVEPSVYSYNQGALVALRTRLALAGDDPGMLDAAAATADAALAHFDGDTLFAHAPAFNAIFFRGLCLLDAHRPRADVQPALEAYLDRAWAEARDARGLFTRGGIGAYDTATVLDQAAMAQMFALVRRPREQRRDLW